MPQGGKPYGPKPVQQDATRVVKTRDRKVNVGTLGTAYGAKGPGPVDASSLKAKAVDVAKHGPLIGTHGHKHVVKKKVTEYDTGSKSAYPDSIK